MSWPDDKLYLINLNDKTYHAYYFIFKNEHTNHITSLNQILILTQSDKLNSKKYYTFPAKCVPCLYGSFRKIETIRSFYFVFSIFFKSYLLDAFFPIAKCHLN